MQYLQAYDLFGRCRVGKGALSRAHQISFYMIIVLIRWARKKTSFAHPTLKTFSNRQWVERIKKDLMARSGISLNTFSNRQWVEPC